MHPLSVPITIRQSRQTDWHAVLTAMRAQGRRSTLDRVTIDEGDDAKDALDRITIPQDVSIVSARPHCRDPRSSSGRPLSAGDQLSHRVCRGASIPQGGFITREPFDRGPRICDRRRAGATTGFGFFFQRNWLQTGVPPVGWPRLVGKCKWVGRDARQHHSKGIPISSNEMKQTQWLCTGK